MGSCISRTLKKVNDKENQVNASTVYSGCQMFLFAELAAATNNFSADSLLGEGRFGPIFKGKLKSTGEVVAIKKFNPGGFQGHEEYLTEVVMLSALHHPNLVKLIGFCIEGEQRLLVLEYVPLGSLEDHLFRRNSKMAPLDWNTRMKIALNVAYGLEFLHLKRNPPIVHRDLKCSKILLTEEYFTKLSDFGLAKAEPNEPHVTIEYARKRRMTVDSDIFSYGVLLLEIITGKKAVDDSVNAEVKDLVVWALPYIEDKNLTTQIADMSLEGKYPKDEFVNVAAIAANCVQEDPDRRPRIDDIIYELTKTFT